MKVLDRSRPYGSICGYVENSERYEQDGCLFREDGTLVGAEPKAPVVAPTITPKPDKQKHISSVKRKPVRPPKTPYPPETKQMAIAMAEAGKTIDEISKALGVHRLAARAWVVKSGAVTTRQDPTGGSDELSRTMPESPS
ncbi:MAG: hypothetical protein QME44_01735 [Thermodesulfobacteriota bacterium]|nr:hypothetical protein [Thermodesulfobacteriota bacterium]